MKWNGITFNGFLQIALAAFAAVGASGVITLDPQVNSLLLTLVSALAGGHAISASQNQK